MSMLSWLQCSKGRKFHRQAQTNVISDEMNEGESVNEQCKQVLSHHFTLNFCSQPVATSAIDRFL